MRTFKTRRVLLPLAIVAGLATTAAVAWAVLIAPVSTLVAAPTISGAHDWARGSVNVTITSVPPGGRSVTLIEYLFDADTVATSTAGAGPVEFTIGGTKEGTTTIRYNAVDDVGGVEPTQTAYVRIDSSAPTFSADTAAVYHNRALITVRATDTVSGVDSIDYTINDVDGAGHHLYSNVSTYGPTVFSATIPTTVTAPGAYTIQYWATDVAGNAPGRTTRNFVVDDTRAPETTATLNPAGAWATQDVTVSIVATDNGGSGVAHSYVATDGGAAIDVTASQASPYQFKVTKTGVTTVQFRSVDASGVSETSQTVYVRIDKSGPAVGTNAVAAYANMARVTVSATDTAPGSGLANLQYRLNAGTTQTVNATPSAAPTYSVEVTSSALGTNTLNYCAQDVAGNKTSGVVTFTVSLADVTPPVSTIETPPHGWVSRIVSLSVTATDLPGPGGVVSGVKATYFGVNAAAVNTYTAPIEVSADGTNTVAVRSIDMSGNLEATKTATVLIDMTRPSAPATLTYTSLSTTSVALAWTPATDTYSGVAYYAILDGDTVIASTTALSSRITSLTPGSSHFFGIRAVDVAGNQSAGVTRLTVSTPGTAASVDVTPSAGATYTLTIPASTTPAENVTVVLPTVTASGTLTIVRTSTPPADALAGKVFFGTYYDVSFTGSFSGTATIVFPYDPRIPDARARDIVVGHWVGSSWVVLPTVIDTVAHTVTVQTTSLSPFAFLEPSTVNLLATLTPGALGYYPAYGKAASVRVRLTDAAGTPLDGFAVELQRQEGLNWVTVGTMAADAAGSGWYAGPVMPYSSKATAVRVVLAPSVGRYAAITPTVMVVPEVKLTTPKPSVKSTFSKRQFTVSGSITPKRAIAGKVKVYRLYGSKWKSVSKYDKKFTSTSKGAYHVHLRLPRGTYRFRTSVGSDKTTSTYGASLSAYSARVKVR